MISNTRTDPPVTAVPIQLTEKCMVLVLAMYGNHFSTAPKNLPQGFASSYYGQLHRAATAKLSLVWCCSRSSSGPTQGLCARKIVATQEGASFVVVASRWQPVLSTMSRWCGGLRSSFAQYSDHGPQTMSPHSIPFASWAVPDRRRVLLVLLLRPLGLLSLEHSGLPLHVRPILTAPRAKRVQREVHQGCPR